ncbi:hypothetical protein ACTML9_04990 [Porphyromonas levii]|nr:transposase [Porphyromonas levii]
MHRRNEVEGTFGTVKMCYGAARIRTRLPETTEVAVAMSFLAKNVITFLRELIRIILCAPISFVFFLQNYKWFANILHASQFFKKHIP